MNLDLWPLTGEGWVCAPACLVLLAFLSIFPQLSVNEMESYSALSMKHISAEFQGRVYHKIFLYSEMTCCVTVRAPSWPGVMNETPFYPFSLLPLSHRCFLFSWQQCASGGTARYYLMYTLLFPMAWFLTQQSGGFITQFMFLVYPTCLEYISSAPR